jgi:hypothetical protein
MSILTDNARSVVYRDGEIIVSMQSGVEIRFPVAANPRLARSTSAQLQNMELSLFGGALARPRRGLVLSRAVGRRLRTEIER